MANEYSSWTGAGRISSNRLFDSDTHEELDLYDRKFEPIRRFLPPSPVSAATNFLVARVATTSKKDITKDVVKLFLSGSWNWGLTSWLESAEFTKVGNNLDQLESDEEIALPDSGWRSVGKVMLFRDLDSSRKPKARIVFENDVGERVSAFCCWE